MILLRTKWSTPGKL